VAAVLAQLERLCQIKLYFRNGSQIVAAVALDLGEIVGRESGALFPFGPAPRVAFPHAGIEVLRHRGDCVNEGHVLRRGKADAAELR
jgi:hypothetical protein